MSHSKPKASRSCMGIILKAGVTLVAGFIAWGIWESAVSPRLSTMGKHRKDPSFLYTCINGNRSVSVIGFSDDGTRFLTRGNKHAFIHDTDTGKKIAEVKGHWRDGRYEVSGDRSVITAKWSDKKTDEVELKFFDWNGEALRTIEMESGAKPGSIAMIAKLKGGFASSEDGRVVVRDASGKRVTELPGEVGGYKVLSSANGNVIVANGIDSLYIWHLDALDGVLTIPFEKVSDAHLNEDGSRIVANSNEEVRVWNTTDGSLLSTWKGDELDLISSTISADGKLIAAGARDGAIVVVDANSGGELHRFENKMNPGTIAFSPQADRIVAGLRYKSTLSGGERIYRRTATDPASLKQHSNLRQSENRISRTPGFAIAWSLKAP